MPEQTLSSPRPRPSWLLNLALAAPFLVLLWINLAHHVLWSDELIAWGIANASDSVSRFFYFTHIEGHPWLWYFILWIASKISHDPVMLKWVEAVFASGVYLVLGFLSPFRVREKLLIFLSYFIAFEYTVMSRMYSVMLLAALLYVARRVRNPEGYVGNLALLGVMASTDASGIILSFGLGAEYAYSTWISHRVAGWNAERMRRLVVAVLVYGLMLGFAAWSSHPVSATSYSVTGTPGSEMFKLRRLVETVADIGAGPWWPLAQEFPHRFWLTNNGLQLRLLPLVPFILFGYWRVFRKDKNLLLLIALTLGLEMIFADVVYRGRPRNWGILFLAFLLGLWMQRAARLRSGSDTRWSRWAYGMMGLAALTGCFALVSVWMRPFSQAVNTANWIRANEPPNVQMVDDLDINLTAVAQHLQRPVYFLECKCFDRFKLFSKSRDSFDPVEMPARVNQAMDDLKTSQLLLVSSKKLTDEQLAGYQEASLEVTPLATFDNAEVEWQNYYLYRVNRR